MNSINCNEKPRKRQCLGPVWLEKKNSITLSVSLSLFACHSTYASVHYWNKKKEQSNTRKTFFIVYEFLFFFNLYALASVSAKITTKYKMGFFEKKKFNSKHNFRSSHNLLRFRVYVFIHLQIDSLGSRQKSKVIFYDSKWKAQK